MESKDGDFIDAPTKSHVVVLARKVLLLAVDVLFFAVAVGIHRTLDILAKWAIPAKWGDLQFVVTAAFAVAFVLVYLRLVYDMLLLFIPSLRPKPKSVVESTASFVNSNIKEIG